MNHYTPLDDKRKPNERAVSALPEVWRLVRPRRTALILGLVVVLVSRVCALALPLSPRWLIDDVIAQGRHELLVPLILGVLGATAIQAVLSIALVRTFARITQSLVVELRCRVHQHVMRLPLAYHDEHKVGALVQRTMSDVQGVQVFLGSSFLTFIGAIMTAILAYGFMLYTNVVMTLAVSGTLLFFAFVVSRVSKRIRMIARRRARAFADVSGRLAEGYGGIRVVKGYRGENREESVFRAGVDGIKMLAIRSVTLTNMMAVTSGIALGVAGALALYLGARGMIDGTLKTGEFFSFAALMGFLAAPVQQAVGLGQQIPEALAGIDRMQEILSNAREDSDPERKEDIGPIDGEVVFDNVRFAYATSDDVLKGISFRADPGSVTAFVGPSGSGKSTTINLIAAFYKATGGQVRVDGKNLSTITLDSYRSQLGLVLQESFLFDGTILENVSFSRPGASEADILEACRRARVDEFAPRLEKGYQTMVGERGVKLSGGQRQRISIARALLANPRILILDEATSSLDTESETLIQEALVDLMAGRTTFVIAHRLSTIQKADQILVIDRGEIVERGKHDELLAAEGKYWQMYTKQQKAEGEMLSANDEPLALTEGSDRDDDAMAGLRALERE